MASRAMRRLAPPAWHRKRGLVRIVLLLAQPHKDLLLDRLDAQVVAARDERGARNEHVVGTLHREVDAPAQPLAREHLSRRGRRRCRHHQKLGARRHGLQQPRRAVGQVVVLVHLVDDEQRVRGHADQPLGKGFRGAGARERLDGEHDDPLVVAAKEVGRLVRVNRRVRGNRGLAPALQLADGRVDDGALGDPHDALNAVVGRGGEVLERVEHARDRLAEPHLEREELALRAVRRRVAVHHLLHQILLELERRAPARRVVQQLVPARLPVSGGLRIVGRVGRIALRCCSCDSTYPGARVVDHKRQLLGRGRLHRPSASAARRRSAQ